MNTNVPEVYGRIAEMNRGYEMFNGEFGYKVEYDRVERCIVVTDIHFGEENTMQADLVAVGFVAMKMDKDRTMVFGKTR